MHRTLCLALAYLLAAQPALAWTVGPRTATELTYSGSSTWQTYGSISMSKGTAGQGATMRRPTGLVGLWNLSNTRRLIKGGYDCNGTTQYLTRTASMPCVSAGALQYPVTMIAWFKLDTTTAANSIVLQLDDSASGGTVDAIRMAVRSTNEVSAQAVDESTVDECLTTASIVDARWHCAICVFASASSRAAYSDVDTTGATDATSVTVSSVDQLAVMTNANHSTFSDGVIAYSAIIPVDLSGAGKAAQRTAIFSGADPVCVSGLSYANLTVSGAQGAAWTLDNVLTDSGPGGYTLTNTGTATAQNNLIVCRDGSGGGYHVRATTGAPTWSSSQANAQGGAAIALASTQFLTRSSTPVVAPPFQVYAVTQSADVTGSYDVVCLGAGNAYELEFRGTQAGDPIRWYVGNQGAQASTSTGYSAATNCLLWGLEAAIDSRSVELNGNSTGTNATSNDPADPATLEIGRAGSGGGTRNLDGQVDLVILLKVAGTADQPAIETFTSNVYNLGF